MKKLLVLGCLMGLAGGACRLVPCEEIFPGDTRCASTHTDMGTADIASAVDMGGCRVDGGSDGGCRSDMK